MIHKSNYKAFKSRLLSRMAQLGTEITLNWVTVTGATIDETTGAKVGGTVRRQSETVKGYVHFPEIATRTVQMFAEIEAGDIIVDVPPDTIIEGRDRLTFSINGEQWTQKKVGTQLSKAWDTVFLNARFCRTLLLRKAT